jgi:hypothetical protein
MRQRADFSNDAIAEQNVGLKRFAACTVADQTAPNNNFGVCHILSRFFITAV